MDKVEKEPTGLLMKLFIAGIGSVFLTLVISDFFEAAFPIIKSDGTDLKSIMIYNFIGVALIEEFSKWIFLVFCTWKNKHFNFLYDGIVYGVFVSLGFATLENCLYVFQPDGGISTAILRAVLSVPAHAFFGVFMGYHYGIARMNKNQKKGYMFFLLLSLLVPILLHGIFDFCLSGDNILFIALYAVFVIVLYVVSFKRIKRLSKNDKYIN
jgi:RsiW-degrading membrane proteinase PrsW (M82 family)